MAVNASNVALGSDHAGFKLKQELIQELQRKGIEFHDFGTFSEERADYPVYAHKVARMVDKGKFSMGVLVCGSGNGVCMTANKYPGVRAALCWNVDIATLARMHNDANILCLPGRFIATEEAIKCLSLFLSTGFEAGRHLTRVEQISNTSL